MSEFVPVHEYANSKKVKLQNVYRWIREGKFDDEDIKREKVCSERLRIKLNARKH